MGGESREVVAVGLCDGQAENVGNGLGVILDALVEVADAEQQHALGVFLLHLLVVRRHVGGLALCSERLAVEAIAEGFQILLTFGPESVELGRHLVAGGLVGVGAVNPSEVVEQRLTDEQTLIALAHLSEQPAVHYLSPRLGMFGHMVAYLARICLGGETDGHLHGEVVDEHERQHEHALVVGQRFSDGLALRQCRDTGHGQRRAESVLFALEGVEDSLHLVGLAVGGADGVVILCSDIPLLRLELGRAPFPKADAAIALAIFEKLLSALVVDAVDAFARKDIVGVDNLIAALGDGLSEARNAFFGSGRVADITLPDAEHRLAESKRLVLPDENGRLGVDAAELIVERLGVESGAVGATPGVVAFHFPEQTAVIGGVVGALRALAAAAALEVLVGLVAATIPNRLVDGHEQVAQESLGRCLAQPVVGVAILLEELALILIVELGNHHGRHDGHLALSDSPQQLGDEVVELYAVLNEADALAEAGGYLFGAVAFLDELRKGKGLFDGVDILTLQVLGYHRVESLVVAHLADYGGNVAKAVVGRAFRGHAVHLAPTLRQLAEGAVTALAADNLVLVGAVAIFVARMSDGPDGDRL